MSSSPIAKPRYCNAMLRKIRRSRFFALLVCSRIAMAESSLKNPKYMKLAQAGFLGGRCITELFHQRRKQRFANCALPIVKSICPTLVGSRRRSLAEHLAVRTGVETNDSRCGLASRSPAGLSFLGPRVRNNKQTFETQNPLFGLNPK
jgi:hypothetical protein